MEIQSVSRSSAASLICRLAIATIAGIQRPLGYGQAVPVAIFGKPNGEGEGLCQIHLVGGQVEMLGTDTVAAAESQFVKLADLAEGKEGNLLPSQATCMRRVTLHKGGRFAGFVGSKEWASLTWAAVIDMLPDIEKLDSLVKGKAGPQLGDGQGWFLQRKEAAPNAQGLRAYNVANGEVLDNLIAIPATTAIHAFFLNNMRTGGAEWLGKDDQASIAAIANATEKVLKAAGAQPGDVIFFGHTAKDPHTAPLDNNSPHALYRSHYYAKDLHSAEAMRGWDGSSAANLRMLHLGVACAVVTGGRMHGRPIAGGLVTFDVEALAIARAKLRRQPKEQAAVVAEAPKVEKTYSVRFNTGSLRSLTASAIREALKVTEGELVSHIDGFPLVHAMAMEGLLPLPAKMVIRTPAGGEIVLPRGGADAGSWATVLSAALVQAPEAQVEGATYQMVDLKDTPVWGAPRLTAFALEGEAEDAPAAEAPTMDALSPDVVPSSAS